MLDIQGPVVVGYDGSPSAGWAVDWAAVEAVRRRRKLKVSFATNLAGLYRPEVTMGTSGGYPHRVAQAIADSGVARARAAAPEVSVDSTITAQGATVALTDASVGASLLVIGGRGRSRLSEALLGTVHFAVTAHARCPVVVVPPPGCDLVPNADHPVVVGVDGSRGSDGAAHAAAAAATRWGAPLRVVGAWQTPPVEHWSHFNVVDEQWREQMMVAVRVGAAKNVTTAAHIVHEEYPGVDVREVTVEGRPSRVLANESDDAGLVVVGARGSGDLASLPLGSVGRTLIHTTGCPVAVTR
ncbi:MAG: universal stress protein [Ornithinimicrobium sp.]